MKLTYVRAFNAIRKARVKHSTAEYPGHYRVLQLGRPFVRFRDTFLGATERNLKRFMTRDER